MCAGKHELEHCHRCPVVRGSMPCVAGNRQQARGHQAPSHSAVAIALQPSPAQPSSAQLSPAGAAHCVLEEHDLAIVGGHHDVLHAVNIDVVQQRRGVLRGLVEGRPPHRLGTIRALQHLRRRAGGAGRMSAGVPGASAGAGGAGWQRPALLCDDEVAMRALRSVAALASEAWQGLRWLR